MNQILKKNSQVMVMLKLLLFVPKFLCIVVLYLVHGTHVLCIEILALTKTALTLSPPFFLSRDRDMTNRNQIPGLISFRCLN